MEMGHGAMAVGPSGLGKLPLPAWDRAEPYCTMDPQNFRVVHRRLHLHRQRLEETQGSMPTLAEQMEEATKHWHHAENMRVSRLRAKREANLEVKRENERLVRRLCSVLRVDSKGVVPEVPGGVLAVPPPTNLQRRRKDAMQIDKENRALLERLMRAAPTIDLTKTLEDRYKTHKELVHRHSRVRRKNASTVLAGPPPQPRPPPGPSKGRPVPPWRKAQLTSPAQQANTAGTGARRTSDGDKDALSDVSEHADAAAEEDEPKQETPVANTAAKAAVKQASKKAFKEMHGFSPPGTAGSKTKGKPASGNSTWPKKSNAATGKSALSSTAPAARSPQAQSNFTSPLTLAKRPLPPSASSSPKAAAEEKRESPTKDDAKEEEKEQVSDEEDYADDAQSYQSEDSYAADEDFEEYEDDLEEENPDEVSEYEDDLEEEPSPVAAAAPRKEDPADSERSSSDESVERFDEAAEARAAAEKAAADAKIEAEVKAAAEKAAIDAIAAVELNAAAETKAADNQRSPSQSPFQYEETFESDGSGSA